MGIIVRTNTKAKATLKLFNQISSYLFEQELEELRGVSSSDIEIIKKACKVLTKIIKSKQ